MMELARRIDASLPAGARRIAEVIRSAGGRACLVGGSLRDLMLDRPAKDWDFATDLHPPQILTSFPRAVEVGVRFGTVLLIEPDGQYEVTTFRRDGVYSDARHPDSVSFTPSIEEDLARRDFTVNAMAFDLNESRLIDPHGGRTDIGLRLIRCVGKPDERFREDALRLLRCIRLAGQLDFAIEEETYLALPRAAGILSEIAMERIRDEFDRILAHERPSVSIDRLHETGLLEVFLPELASSYGVSQNRYHAFDIFYHSLFSADQAPRENRAVRLAALLHDLGKVDTRRIEDGRVTFYNHQVFSARKAETFLRRLRYPNDERERVVHLIAMHMFHYDSEWTDSAVRRFVRSVGTEHLDDLFATRAADTMGNGLRRGGESVELNELKSRIAAIQAREEALSVKDLAIDGHDLMRVVGLAEGPAIGKVLEALLEEVLEDPARNEREALLARARELAPDLAARYPGRLRKTGGGS